MSVQLFPVQRDGLLLVGRGMSTFSHSAYNKLPGGLTFKSFLEIEETIN